jgi:hypothetical protein
MAEISKKAVYLPGERTLPKKQIGLEEPASSEPIFKWDQFFSNLVLAKICIQPRVQIMLCIMTIFQNRGKRIKKVEG